MFPWGNNWPPSGRAGNYADATAKDRFPNWTIIQGYRDGFAGTAPVGSFAANPFGLYDMGGNVWEWCEDVWHENYDGAPADGRAWTSGGSQDGRVLRGGSWLDDGRRLLRSADRDWLAPVARYNDIGFRVVVPSGTP